ncbi:hypothetical protein LC040_03120 [Bacillus tianshenii]|nr:hypothetical protein LC040_03120 [Bacillus tianshenii]
MNYSYEDFVSDLHIGREIEFKYRGKIYATLNVKEGFGIGEHHKVFDYFQTVDEMLNKRKINGQKLIDIWSEVEVIAIF